MAIEMECLNCGYEWTQERFTGGSILWGASVLFSDNKCPNCGYSPCHPKENKQEAEDDFNEVRREIRILEEYLKPK